jgi:hypothetical protein
MTQIVLNTELERDFQSLKGPARIVNKEGRVLGTFRPALEPPYPPELMPPISDEELAQIYADPRRYSTEEVLQQLEGL